MAKSGLKSDPDVYFLYPAARSTEALFILSNNGQGPQECILNYNQVTSLPPLKYEYFLHCFAESTFDVNYHLII